MDSHTWEVSGDHRARGWYTRGYLPHCDLVGRTQFITFRLADALPLRVVRAIEAEILDLPEEKQEAERRRRLEKWLDQGFGACHLARPEIAEIVQQELIRGHTQRYELLAWTIMPNHVHTMVNLADDVNLEEMVQSWKGRTARLCNLALGRTGRFWFREYWDRFIRSEAHLDNSVAYIEQNPVKAMLCKEPGDWMYGSAYSRDRHAG